MKPSLLALFVFISIGFADDKKPSLLNLDQQISDPLREQQQEKKEAEKKASKAPPLKKTDLNEPPCDLSHGDCLRNNPEQIDKLNMERILGGGS